MTLRGTSVSSTKAANGGTITIRGNGGRYGRTTATIHEGGARKLEKRGIKTDRGKINREIKTANGQMQTIDILTKQTQKEIINIREAV